MFIVESLKTKYKKSKENKNSPSFSVPENIHISHFNVNLFVLVSPCEKDHTLHIIIKCSRLGSNDCSDQSPSRCCAQWEFVFACILLQSILRRPWPTPILHLISLPPNDYDFHQLLLIIINSLPINPEWFPLLDAKNLKWCTVKISILFFQITF